MAILASQLFFEGLSLADHHEVREFGGVEGSTDPHCT